MKEHRLDKRKHIRFRLAEKKILCYLENIKCRPVNLSLDAVRFKVESSFSLSTLIGEKKELNVVVGERLFSFKGKIKPLAQRDNFLFIFDKGNSHKVLQLLGEIIRTEKC